MLALWHIPQSVRVCVCESVLVLKGFALMPTACFMPLMRHRHFRIDIKIVTLLRFRRLAMKCAA